MDTQSLNNSPNTSADFAQHSIAPESETKPSHSQSREMMAPPEVPSSSLPFHMSRQAIRSPSWSTTGSSSPTPQRQLGSSSSQDLSSAYSQSVQQNINPSPSIPNQSTYPPHPTSNQPAYSSPYSATPSSTDTPPSNAPQHQFSATPRPSQQGLNASSHIQRGTIAFPFASIESYADDLEQIIRKGTAETRVGEGGTKRIRGPNLTRDQKLVLARLCNEHSVLYEFGSWGKFWAKVSEEYKKTTGHEHKAVQNTVERWIKIRRTKLFEQEMESGTEEERNPFTQAVDKFAERWQHSHDQAAGKAKVKTTKEGESDNVRQVGNAIDEGIVDIEDDNSPEGDSTPAATEKRAKRPTAEDRMADSFARIADSLVSSESQGEGGQGKRRRKRQRSGSESQEEGRKKSKEKGNPAESELLMQMAAQMEEMNRVILSMNKKLDERIQGRVVCGCYSNTSISE